MMSIEMDSIAILNIHGFGYLFIIAGTSKCEAINLLRNDDLSRNSGSL